MILLMLLLAADIKTPIQSTWDLRSGHVTDGIPVMMGASLYYNINKIPTDGYSCTDILRIIEGGDISMVVPLATLAVSEGNIDLAEIYWKLEGRELPATRGALLAALAWFGRHELYPVMSRNQEVPSDMEGTMHSDQCGAVCTLGWMTTRADGLFHADELVSPSDIRILSQYFPSVDPSMKYLFSSSLDHMFRELGGTSP